MRSETDTNFELSTLSVRAGQMRTQFREHSEAMFLTSSFVFDSAEQAAECFAATGGEHFVYSRFSNPTVEMFQRRLAALEGAEACIATASGMSAILSLAMSMLKSGDHVVCSNAVFGATIQLFGTILSRFGISTTFVPLADLGAWEKAASKPATRLFFVETPSNPLLEVCDLPALSAIAHKAGALLAVDNCLCTPILQRPLELGADIVVHSATKFLDGQGRVLGGAVLGSRSLILDGLLPFLRTAGPSMSPFNAWVILKGLETLEIRIQKQSESALSIARWLERHRGVKRVYYPGLESHPQYALASVQQRSAGAVLSFEVEGGRDSAWRVINCTRIFSITANLGDVKSTITHPATTTHGRVSSEARAASGIRDGLVRIAIGLESVADLKRDLDRGLAS